MLHDILVFLPLAAVILTALITRRMAESLIAGIFIAMLLLHKQNFFSGIIGAFYSTLSDSSFQFVLMIMIGFGGLIKLLQESGALMGFRNLISKFARGPKASLLTAWLLSILMFADEYLNTLTSTFALRDITDKNGVPREHLAFQSHVMACSLCMTVPFTSWTAFTISLIKDYGMDFSDYLHAVAYMFFPLIYIVICPLLALGVFPRIGVIKSSYERIEQGGAAFLREADSNALVELETVSEEKVSSALNAVIPILALIAGVFIFDSDLLYGLLFALIAQFLMYTGQKLMSVGEFFDHFFKGAKSMTSMAIIIGFGFTLSKANEDLGFFEVLTHGAGQSLPPALIPAAAFLLAGLCVFALGSCWVVMLLTVPVFLSLASASGISVILTLGAVMSGVGMGFSLCFYADTVFMTAAGTGVSNLRIIKTAAPYGLIAGTGSLLAYVILGAVM